MLKKVLTNSTHTDPLLLTTVKVDIQQIYGEIQAKKKSNNKNEQVLLIGTGKRKYKGLCKISGKRGLKWQDVSENKKNESKRPKNWQLKKRRKVREVNKKRNLQM